MIFAKVMGWPPGSVQYVPGVESLKGIAGAGLTLYAMPCCYRCHDATAIMSTAHRQGFTIQHL